MYDNIAQIAKTLAQQLRHAAAHYQSHTQECQQWQLLVSWEQTVPNWLGFTFLVFVVYNLNDHCFSNNTQSSLHKYTRKPCTKAPRLWDRRVNILMLTIAVIITTATNVDSRARRPKAQDERGVTFSKSQDNHQRLCNNASTSWHLNGHKTLTVFLMSKLTWRSSDHRGIIRSYKLSIVAEHLASPIKLKTKWRSSKYSSGKIFSIPKSSATL